MKTKVINQFARIPDITGSSLTIGKFDGVHRGHQKIIRQTVAYAQEHKLRSIVMTFARRFEDIHYAHPRQKLYPTEQNIAAIAELGPDYIVVIDFSADFGRMSADEFFQKLIDYYRVKAISVGKDFRFGHSHSGDVQLLRSLARKAYRITQKRSVPLRVRIFPFLTYRKQKVGTSAIREAVAAGNCEAACAMLGRPYSISGTVEKGKQLGRTIGFPTVNIPMRHDVVFPCFGVYAGFVSVKRKMFRAVVFAGTSALNSQIPRIEAHLLDFRGNLYGVPCTISLLHYLRSIKKVDSIDILKKLIADDVQNARAYFSRSNVCHLTQKLKQK